MHIQVTLYLDILFGINWIVVFSVLNLTAFFLKERIRLRFLFFAACVGAICICVLLLFEGVFCGVKSVAFLVGISMGTVRIAFGKCKFIKKWFCATTIMFLMGSVMNYVRMMTNQTIYSLCQWMVCFWLALWGVCLVIWKVRKWLRNTLDLYFVELCHGNHIVQCKTLLDTGNFLMDPLYGKPVLLVSRKIAKACFDEQGGQIIEAYEKNGSMDYQKISSFYIQQKSFFHEIPYYSVGNFSGKLLCFLVDEMKVKESNVIHRKQPVAVAPPYLFEKTEFQGLIHKECV